MNFEEAKQLLSSATRWELRDHAFGDCEFGWTDAQGNHIAEGYSGGGRCDIWFYDLDRSSTDFTFTYTQSRELKTCGSLGNVERNDETGPYEYVEGQNMPGLTKEGVLKELTDPRE